MRDAQDAQVMPPISRSMRLDGLTRSGAATVIASAVFRDVVTGLVDRVADGRVADAPSANRHDLRGQVDVDRLDARNRADRLRDRRAAVLAADAGDAVDQTVAHPYTSRGYIT